jgi:catechol 2,3-dioxygenase-like lactoylglutathione lyase family enzyme
MKQYIAHVSLIVDDYDDAIAFYTQKIGFELIEDTKLNAEKRWVLIKPKGATETAILLAKASNTEQESRIGNQTGGRVFIFLYTDNLWRDYHIMIEKGVKFVREPKEEIYGTVAVFTDLYGNQWDLLEPKNK